MNRRGLALVAVLWLIVALAGVTSAGMAVARQATLTARNRIWLVRARWAQDACWAILAARHATRLPTQDSLSPRLVDLPATSLGGALWCRATWEHPEWRLNLNAAGPETLLAVLGEPALVAALLDWRDRDSVPRPGGAEWAWYRAAGRPEPRNGPLAALVELLMVRGFDSARVAAVESVVTVEPGSRLDLNSAPLDLLARLPGMGPEAVSLIARRRVTGATIAGWVELASGLSAPARQLLEARGDELRAVLGAAPEVRLLRLEAGLAGTPLRAQGQRHVVLLPERMATVAVEAP